MPPPNFLYSAILLSSGLICLVVASLVWQLRRQSPGAVSLALFLISLVWWNITYAFFWANLVAPQPHFWLDLTYFGAVAAPTLLLIFAFQLTQKGQWLTPVSYFALAIEPVVVLLALWTDPSHHLFFGGKREVNVGMILDGGVLFWGNVIYSYLAILIAMLLLAQAYRQAQGMYRNQFATVLVGIGFTWLNSIVFITGFNPLPGADNTPFSFTITGLFFAYALVRYRLLGLVPIARSMLIDSLSDGLMVLDAENRILDINRAAKKWLPDLTIGDSIETIEDRLPATLRQYRQYSDLRIEVMLENPHRYLDTQISSVRNARGHVLGKLVVWRDITELKLLQIKLHTLATHDSLTNVYNRRHFEQLAGAEWAQCKRHHRPLVVILVDIDHFKSINDAYGHQAGDRVLVRFAEICLQTKRVEDIFARWGGEEFIFLLPDARPETARVFINRLFEQISQAELIAGIKDRRVTCSIGAAVNTFQDDDSLELLIRRADDALYQAKNAGRNRAVFYNFPEFDVIG